MVGKKRGKSTLKMNNQGERNHLGLCVDMLTAHADGTRYFFRQKL
jgi:hypothetical protein